MLKSMPAKWSFGTWVLCGLLVLTTAPTQAWELPHTPEAQAGIAAYRDQRYDEALKLLTQAHSTKPEDSRVTYYLAITLVQRGRIQEARRLYNEIIILDPKSEAAEKARAGLELLPDPKRAAQGWDEPPRPPQTFNESARPADPQAPPGWNPAAPAAMTPNLNPAALMMMMGQGGMNPMGSNGMGVNPMLWMMNGMGGGMPGATNMDPSVMSTLLMNSMMQGMDMGTGTMGP